LAIGALDTELLDEVLVSDDEADSDEDKEEESEEVEEVDGLLDDSIINGFFTILGFAIMVDI
jgi:hypothetical protein